MSALGWFLAGAAAVIAVEVLAVALLVRLAPVDRMLGIEGDER